ncbi:MAG: lysylphosphatidylglycerol synthase transmembrane domain-containing protein [Promethearchaeota archaeon]
MKTKRSKKIYTLIRWAIGIIILYVVFQKIDFDQLLNSIAHAKLWLIILGLTNAPVLIFIAAFRWRWLMRNYFNEELSFNFTLGHYWKGLALGFFTPASIGLDAYRIVICGKRFGKYTASAVIIIAEKILALITCMSIVVALYPIVPIKLVPEFKKVFYLAYVMLVACILLLILVVIVLRNKMLSVFFKRFENYVRNMLEIISRKININLIGNNKHISFHSLIEPLVDKKIIIIIAFSFCIQFVSSIKSQVFFCSLDYDIPFVVNLFAAPMIYFIFVLPISFGSLGIREGVYIIIYGMFGVPIEIALIVSFFNLLGMLLNSLIGGTIMLASKPSGTTVS